jgi:phospholipase/lecithinase/hemolysin
MKRFRPLLCALFALFVLVLASASPTSARQFTKLIVFGDSYSDTGNVSAATGGALPPSPPYALGRFSNGLLWVDYLAAALDLTTENFAVAAALTSRVNFLDGFFGLDFPGLLDEIDMFAAATPSGADPHALYVVWAGVNDFLASPSAATISDAVNNIVDVVRALRDLGAQHIVVPNMVDIGVTPEGQASEIPALLSELSVAFNGVLSDTFRSAGLAVVTVDVFGLLNHMRTDPAEFGFTNVTTPCLSSSGICADPDEYIFWDFLHLTTRGHQILAEKFTQTINQSLVRRHNR